MIRTDQAHPGLSSAAATGAALALILAPVAALFICLLSAGWLMIFILLAAPALLTGYVLQVVLAAVSLLRVRGSLRRPAFGRRAVAAAWLTSAGVLVTGFFINGGGDTSWGSTFMLLIGAESDPGWGSVSAAISAIGAVCWLGGWAWLVVEWIVAAVAARRARETDATASPAAQIPGIPRDGA